MLTSVAISLNAAPGSGPSLPSTVAQNWIFDFKRLALQDILAGRFGAQRHSLSSYAMMYRLDVAPEVLRRAVGLAEGESEAVREQSLSFNELIEQAKVWLSFDADIVKEHAQKKNAVVPRIPIRHTAVRHGESTPKDANIPDSIERQWRADLGLVVLQDLLDYRFGARRHTILSGYDLIYRLDVSEDVLYRCARNVSGAPKEPGTPTAAELLSCARVWLEFEDRSATAPLAQPLAHVEESMPASPALSDSSQITLVGEPDAEYAPEVKTKPKKSVRFSETITIKHFRKSDAVCTKSNSPPSTEIRGLSDGIYERGFGPVHPNRASQRRRRTTTTTPQPSASATSQSNVATAIYATTSALYQFLPFKSTINALTTAAYSAADAAFLSFSSFSLTESGSVEPWFHYGTEHDMTAPCY